MVGHGPPPIRGRDPELATLGQALRDTAGGRGRIVVAEGEAGIGKTRLLQEAWTMARASGFLLLQ
ncbi:MAG TPA: AAA family ATPase, partial [Candidatus Dormibacteraeota bacterium]